MPAVFAELTFITLTADGDTPASLVQHNGKIVGVPPDVPIPSVGELFGIPGRRVGNNWVMTGPIDKVAQAVDAIPAGGIWKDQAARDVYLTNAVALLAAGVPAAAVKTRLPALYNAAVANHTAP